MAAPKDMRFYCTPTEAVPVGPKACPTYRGQPRESHTIQEAAEQTGWDVMALAALYNATYPPTRGDDDAWLTDWCEAMFDPAVKARLAYFDARRGSLPREAFLIALLDSWDSLPDDDKKHEIVEALGVRFGEPNVCYNTVGVAAKGGDDE